MKRIKHVYGIESAEGREGVQNGIGWSEKFSVIVTFKPNPKWQKGANHVQIWKRVFPARAIVNAKTEMGTRLFCWRNGQFRSTSGRAVKEVRKA